MRDGLITGVVAYGNSPEGYTSVDVGSLVVMPGLVDPHVHINEPGRTEWEGFHTATRAAAAGGITTLVDMPLNSSPVTTTSDAFQAKRSAAQNQLWVDCGFYGGLVQGNAFEMSSLIRAGVLGIKAFLVHSGIDEFTNALESDLRAAMSVLSEHGIPLLVHAELSPDPPLQPTHSRSYNTYLESRPRMWEHNAIELLIRLCKEYGCRVHIVHLSSADAVPMLDAARQSGLPITVETCPHYLYFSAGQIHDGNTLMKCAPPIRENENRERLWNALLKGTIDLIASDHSPCPPAMKCLDSGDFFKAWGGIASLQFCLSIIWTEGKKRGVTISRLAQWMSEKPAALVGLQHRKGMIAAGFDADFVIWDPDKRYSVTTERIVHRHKISPYVGEELFGTVEQTYLRGTRVFDRGAFAGPAGEPILKPS